MNPHQVDAALFALKSPIAAGVLLADEVGLGKTIEAGLVIAQHWAQQCRRILLIVPATLRKQWSQELADKFLLPSQILESRTYALERKSGHPNPFASDDKIVITSYEFAASKAENLEEVAWDLVVLDEAHKLRNLYKGESAAKRATVLNEALRDRRKVLLTATPFQNSLMELYGLVSFISGDFFGSKEAFQLQYASGRQSEARQRELKHRLESICHRTLRRQVQQEGGIKFTKRFSITQDFTPSDDEFELYQKVSAYLQDESILAIKPGARHLVTLVVRKILASSSFAIADTLETIIARLQASHATTAAAIADYETDDEFDEGNESLGTLDAVQAEQNARVEEIERLKGYRDLAKSIQTNRKGEALLVALKNGMEMTWRLGGVRKAVIFTESRRTQDYLRQLLEGNGYPGRVVLLNGSNSDTDSKAIHAQWLSANAGTAAISGSKSADMKAAVVDAFRHQRDILITTEAGGEGINLQFCSLLINYDLPWNPQRVEQRIGRVHRYGQKSDVVVVNFVNRKNRADELVFELLAKKFKLFDGVFGASDEILGTIESGVDIEQRINRIYQQCRTQEQIESEFAQLQAELDVSISEREASAKLTLLEHFDEEVVRKLRSRRDSMQRELSLYEHQFQRLVWAERPGTQIVGEVVELQEGRFVVSWPPAEQARADVLRPDQGLGASLCQAARTRDTPSGTLHFHYAAQDGQLSDVQSWIGRRGRLRAGIVTIETAVEKREVLVASAVADDGKTLAADTADRLLRMPAQFEAIQRVAEPEPLFAFDAAVQAALAEAGRLNEEWFQQEADRLDRWAEDQRLTLRTIVDELDLRIRDCKRWLRQLATLEEKTGAKREIKRLEQGRDDALLDFYHRKKVIADKEEEMLNRVEALLKMRYQVDLLFDVEWSLEA